MEPNKMEEDFRKKLNAREIQPSDAAWDRLDAMLSMAENKKPKRSFTWLYVAAGLALFFTVGLFLFQQEKNNPEIQIENPTVVTSEEKQEVSPESGIVVSQPGNSGINNDAVAVGGSHTKTKVKTNAKKSGVEVKTNFQQYTEKSEKEEIAEIIPQKAPEIQPITVNAEKLLADADQPKDKPHVKVSANLLLSSVEGELNQEFRETTLQRLNRNFKTVKTAVANRNYE